ncbi:glycosyltransferase family 2 protein [Candidatus Amesbacteria bacterium]|nr:glycosyltransferase family 2 protein [Candidatus Amesbacteria bacterium]
MHNIDLTILVPAYNEEKSILKLLNSINAANLNKINTEIIVLINGSTDNTTQVVNNFKKKKKNSNLSWVIFETNERGKTKALNLGLSMSKSEIIINIDADCKIKKESLIMIFNKLKICEQLLLVGGLDRPDFRCSDKQSLLYQFQVVHQIYREVRGRVLPVGRLMGYKRSSFDKFPKYLHSEDTWLALDLAKRHGWKSVKILTDAVVNFSPALNWLDYIKQESRFECGLPQILDQFPELENIYNQRRINVEQKSKDKIESEIFEKMDMFKIPRERWTQMNDIIDSVIIENALIMNKQLISKDGNWDPTRSTKNE